MPKPSQDEKITAKPPKRKRRWRKVFAVLFLFLIGFLILLNGPGSRWFLRKTIISQLSKQGLEGDTTVSGRLISGYTLKNTSFTGSGPFRTLKADRLAIRYQLGQYFTDELDVLKSIEAEGVRVILHTEPKTEDKEDSDWRKIFESLQKFHPYVDPVEINISDVEIVLHQENKEPRSILLESLSHTPGSDVFAIKQFTPGTLLPTPPPIQNSQLTWTPDSLSLDQFIVTQNLEIRALRANFPKGKLITVETAVQLYDSSLQLTATEEGNITILLGEEPINLSSLFDLLGLDQPVTGEIARLSVNASGLLGPPNTWRSNLDIATSDLTWQERPLPEASLTSELSQSGLNSILNVAGDTLTVKATTPPLSFEKQADLWKELPIKLELNNPSLAKTKELYLQATGKTLPDLVPTGSFQLNGTLTTGNESFLNKLALDWTASELRIKENALPNLLGTFTLADQQLEFATTRETNPEGENFDIKAAYDLSKMTYQASTKISLKDGSWLGPLIAADKPSWHPSGPLALSWKGAGNITDNSHQGSYNLETLTAKIPDETLTNASIKGSYQWPGKVEVESIAIRNGSLQLSGGLSWSPERSTFKKLTLEDGTGILTTINGTGPGGPKLDDILKTKTPFDLSINAQEFNLERLRKLLPITLDKGYKATLKGDFQLTGTPESPSLNGSLQAFNILTPNETVPALSTTLKLTTVDNNLEATGEIAEAAGPLATLRGNIPIDIEQWAEDPTLLKKLPLSAAINVTALPLTRLQVFAPVLKDTEGTVNIDIKLAGTSSEPSFEGSAGLELKNFPLPNTPHQAIRDTTLLVNFDKERITVQPSSCTIAGGTIRLSGQADLSGESPVLDFTLDADNALLWRDELLVSRVSGGLKLSGPYESAALSGELGIVESLIHKDIEIIPLRPNTTAASPPKLPQFSKKKGALSFELPAPFNAWPLNIKIFTKDPFLIRGNLATGQVIGDIAVTGTFSKPLPKGSIKLKEIEAILPFSTFNIKKGTILIHPEDPLDPVLDLRGRSVVNSTDISLYLFGPISNPKYNASSDPPMKESDILALLTTGASTADLEDPALAQMRFFQLVVDEARRKANASDSSRFMKLFRRPLNAIQDLNLRVAENDPFSGRKFNSASLELSDKWTGVAQFDDEGNTRGLLRYSLRFK